MTSANLGTKRVCPKCAAKFYDFGVIDPITCPKCGKSWSEGAKKKPPAKPVKPEKPVVKPVRKRAIEDEDLLGADLPEVEEGDGIEEIEPIEDEGVEMTSLEEVEEHEEDEESDPNSDDAEDGMFTEMVGEEKLVDDLEDHLESDEDEENEENGDDDAGDDEDEDDDPKSKRRR